MPPQTDGPVPAIGYIRVSTAREEMISPELQEAAIRDWARRHNRDVIEIVPDLDKSGRNFKRRVQEAIQAVRDARAREIIVWKFSRFGRNRLGWATHLDIVESAGGQLISATEEVDARTASGRFTRGMLAEVAAFESDRASEQWKETHAYRLAAGLPAAGGPRFGYIRRGRLAVPGDTSHYRTDPEDPLGERYEPDPDLTDIYRSLYDRYIAGEGGPPLVRWLNAHRIPTAGGGQWALSTFFRTMDSGFAAGYLRVHDDACPCNSRGHCRNVTYIKGAQDPIITEETWQAYRARRAAAYSYPPRSRNPVYPLSGIIRCGACERRLRSLSGPHGPGYAWRCHYAMEGTCSTGCYARQAYAEAEVLDALAQYAAEIEARAAAGTPRPVAEPVVKVDVDRISSEVARIDRALVRLRKLRALDEDDDAQAEREYIAARDELRAERAQLEERLHEARDDEPPKQMEDYGPAIAGLLEEWDLLTAQEKRDLLASVVRDVTVFRAGPREPARIEVTPMWAAEP